MVCYKTMKLVKKMIKYVNDKGEQKEGYNFYLMFDNGSKIAIKPVFKEDYCKMVFISEKEGQ